MAVVPNNATASSTEALAARYRSVRHASLRLAEPLAPEDQVVQVCAETSPTKWHLAHTTWFFERFCLAEHVAGYAPFDERYAHLFNSYYYTIGEMHRRPERGLLSRPTVAEIHAYREHVDDAMCALLDARGDEHELDALVTLGLNHEQQHQELLLTDIKQVFFANPLAPAYRDDLPVPPRGAASPFAFIGRPGGIVEIGAPAPQKQKPTQTHARTPTPAQAHDTTAGRTFAFDNETPRHRVLLRDHALADRLVTNAEYREFIRAGAYRQPELWLADGWSKVREAGWNRPLCWSADLAREFTLGGWREIDEHAPVSHVSYYEADAFARWAGARLPSEAEWEVAAANAQVDGNLLDAGFLHPVASQHAAAESRSAFDGAAPRQLFGDVWEWCSSSYSPYPGFEPLAGSLGEYNGKFMCNQLVVRGGSCVTWRDHVRATYRSFFYPHDRWQFLGFRLAKDT